MNDLFVTQDFKHYFYGTEKYVQNSIVLTYYLDLNVENINYLLILNEILKDKFDENLCKFPLNFNSQIIKRSDYLIFFTYFQFCESEIHSINREIIQSIFGNLNVILNQEEGHISDVSFCKYKEKILRISSRSEKDYKFLAIKECLKEIESSYIPLYDKKNNMQDISYQDFIKWMQRFNINAKFNLFHIGKNLNKEIVEASNEFFLEYKPFILPVRKKIDNYEINNSKIDINKTINSSINYLTIGLRFRGLTPSQLSLLSNYLGGGGYSLLFNKVREDNNLVYTINTSTELEKKLLVINAKVIASNLEKVEKIVNEELEKLYNGYCEPFIFKAALNAFKLNSAQIQDRPLSFVRAYINEQTTVEVFDSFNELSEEDFSSLKGKIDKQVTVKYWSDVD